MNIPTRKKDQSHREGKEHYQSKEHKIWRKKVLKKHPLCVYCLNPDIKNKDGKKGRILRASTVADHIIPISKGGDKINVDNGQGLCKYHHDAKSAKERWNF